MTMTPCKDCPTRHPVCHDTCPKYAEFKRQRAADLAYTKQMTDRGVVYHIEGRPHRFDVLRETNPKEWEFWMKHVCRDENGNWYGWGRVLAILASAGKMCRSRLYRCTLTI